MLAFVSVTFCYVKRVKGGSPTYFGGSLSKVMRLLIKNSAGMLWAAHMVLVEFLLEGSVYKCNGLNKTLRRNHL